MITQKCPHCGEDVTFEVAQTTRKGALVGLSITEMTDEQLKREIVNASSVLSKAVKRGAAEEVINGATARLEAAKLERASRKATNVVAEETVVTDLEAGEITEGMDAEIIADETL